MKSDKHNTNNHFDSNGFRLTQNKHRKNSKILAGTTGIFAVAAIMVSNLPSVNAETVNTTFNVNVKETLSVSLTTPSEWSSGDADEFLRNKVSLNVSSNNISGFTASMYAKDDTSLTNTIANTETLPTLANSSVKNAFPTNHWGYSLGSGNIDSSLNSNVYGETDAGNNDSKYYPLVSTTATPITILTGNAGGSQDIYFGAKADMSQAAGTYTSTVVISVVSGSIDAGTNPVTPTNPAKPNPASEVATYNEAPTSGSAVGGSTAGTTTYTYRRSTPGSSSSTGTNTTTTQVSDGDNISAYQGYTAPQGVVENTFSNVSSGSPLAAGLAATSAAAAAAGTFFFILAKRREEDEEDEQQI